MSFDETLLPLRVGFGSGGGPAFSTEIITVEGGYERRTQNWSQARRRFDAATALRSPADIATLLAFFHARAGRARGFRLRDWSDYSSASDGMSTPAFTNQTIGTGNAVLTTFQLIKTYSSGGVNHVRDIRKPVSGSVIIGVNGVQQMSGWSVNTVTGIVTFTAAPASGATITAGYQFDVPVRFDTDRLDLSTDDFTALHGQVPIIEVRA